MSELRCMAGLSEECEGEIKERTLYENQFKIELCEKHLKDMKSVKLPEDKDKDELEKEDYQHYLNNINKFFKSKGQFNPLNILEDGEIPKFESDYDRYKCAIEVGDFIRQAKIMFENHLDYLANLTKLADKLGPVYLMIIIRKLTLPQMESWMKSARTDELSKRAIKEMLEMVND